MHVFKIIIINTNFRCILYVTHRGILGDQMFNKPSERLFSELCELDQFEDNTEQKGLFKEVLTLYSRADVLFYI